MEPTKPMEHTTTHTNTQTNRTTPSAAPSSSGSSDTWKNYAIVFLAGAVLLLSIGTIWGGSSGAPTAAAVGNAPTAAPSPSPAPSAAPIEVNLEGAHILGDPDAPVTVVEWSDFECPFCARAYSDAVTGIKNNYVESGQVNIVFKHFPLSFHPQAEPAALASECAGEQGKFWEYHDLIFENQQRLSASQYDAWAEQLGLDTAQFSECVSSQKYAAKVRADFVEGQQAGIRGTPGFLVNGELISGAQPYAVFAQKIDSLLASQ